MSKRLHHAPFGRKKIAEWSWYNTSIHEKTLWDVTLICDMKQKKTYYQAINRTTEKSPQQHVLENVDVFALQEEAKQVMHGFGKIEWARKILVTTDINNSVDDEHNASLSVSYGFVEIGMSGKSRVKRRVGSTNITDDWPITGFDTYRGMSALIDDTPENREKLTAILSKLSELGDRLKDMLSPQTIDKTLANLQVGLLLDGPPAQAKRVVSKPAKGGR